MWNHTKRDSFFFSIFTLSIATSLLSHSNIYDNSLWLQKNHRLIVYVRVCVECREIGHKRLTVFINLNKQINKGIWCTYLDSFKQMVSFYFSIVAQTKQRNNQYLFRHCLPHSEKFRPMCNFCLWSKLKHFHTTTRIFPGNELYLQGTSHFWRSTRRHVCSARTSAKCIKWSMNTECVPRTKKNIIKHLSIAPFDIGNLRKETW